MNGLSKLACYNPSIGYSQRRRGMKASALSRENTHFLYIHSLRFGISLALHYLCDKYEDETIIPYLYTLFIGKWLRAQGADYRACIWRAI